ncbi:zinc finger protein 862-like [Micropterus dolomieu]|uniref:zinc finger protein 862-like n=1 Tax=Micropterus dolomieu TaxID=147949 RepID=UPI001E8DB2CB|nr:zinc finger protein 862-like [Micropterus dolomieu]
MAMSEQTSKKMKLLFRTVHAIGKKARPLSDFEWMCDLDEQKVLSVGSTYRNEKQAKEFMHYIAEVERNNIRGNLKNTKFLSIMSDGSTDSPVKEEELVYVRFCHKGKIESKFVGINAVEKADAAHISKAISDIMEGVCDEWESKLVALGTDGAAVMTGAKSGVVSRLKGDRAYIIGIHCMAHRLELAFSDAICSNVMFQKIEDLLSGLYTFYHTSSLNRANLVNSFQALGHTPLVPTRISGTRWVGHLLRALDHFLRGYQGLVQHLEQIQSADAQNVRVVQQAKARKYYSTVREAVVVRFCGFLHDTLTHLSNLSACLQRSTITIAEAHSSLCSTQAVLKKYKSKKGPMMNATMGNSYEGISLTRGDIKTHVVSQDKMLDSLVKSMTDRFQDASVGVLCATKLVSFTNWPESGDAVADFGDSELETLVDHFKPVLEASGIHVERIPDQWKVLKVLIYQEPQSLEKISWFHVNRIHQHSCPDLLALVDLVLSFPASTAECERGFSTMKQVKTDWRSNLKSDTLSDLLIVQLSSPEIKEYDPSKAVMLWHQNSVRSRRPEFMDHAKSNCGRE